MSPLERNGTLPTRVRRVIRPWLRSLACGAARLQAIGAAVRLLASTRFTVQGNSMRPSIEQGHYLLVDRLAYLCAPPRRGHLVVLRDPGLPGVRNIKRIVGLPGEHLRMDMGRVLIDGTPLEEPYAQEQAQAPTPLPSQWVLAPGEFFVLGDHRMGSRDSRAFGPIQASGIIGRVWLRYWPTRAWGRLK